jgi:hypothetical protein
MRRAGATVLCLGFMLSAETMTVFAIAQGPGQGGRFSCDKIDVGVGSPGFPIKVDPGSERDCSPPVGEATVTNPSTDIQWSFQRAGQPISADQVQKGDTCEGHYLAGPTFVKRGDFWHVQWKDPLGDAHELVIWVNPPPGGEGKFLSEIGSLVGFNIVQVPMKLGGEWKVDGGQGHCDGKWEPELPRWTHPEGGNSGQIDPRVELTPYVPNPPGGPMAVVPKPTIQQLLRNPTAVNPGQIAMAPKADQGLVNLDQHMWIEGATVHEQTTWRLVADSLPDATGRGLRYQYYVTVGLSGVDWTLGDSSGSQWWPDTGEPGPSGHNPTHRYSEISAKGGAGPPVNGSPSYLVQALEHYTVDVTAIWFDGRATRQQDLGDLGLSFATSPPSVGLYVGQVQGVPR